MDIALFGTGGHARVVAEIVALEGKHRVMGLVSADGAPGDFVPGLTVIASNADIAAGARPHGITGGIIALGAAEHRLHIAGTLQNHLPFVRALHPAAVVSASSELGPGSVVMAGVVVNPGVKVGAHCILNTSCSVDHDCHIGDFSHISPGAVLAGHVTIGKRCWLGAGCVVVDRITIGDDVKVAAGALVHSDLPAGSRVDAKGKIFPPPKV